MFAAVSFLCQFGASLKVPDCPMLKSIFIFNLLLLRVRTESY